MKRRLMMWMTIVCILVVGVSVTRMTRDFVVSQGVEAAAVLGGGQLENKAVSYEMSVSPLMDIQTEMMALDEAAAEAVEAASMAPVAETENMVTEETFAEIDALETMPAETPEEYASGTPKSPLISADVEITQETVKSPLDPVINKAAIMETEEETILYNVEMFFERFAQTEQNALKLWENVTSDNRSAYLAAAEQEHLLWDYELNHLNTMIRSKMSDAEVEALKIGEVEWLKERDLYAEKVAAKSAKKNAYNQNPDYAKALAEKTKERCYWLVSEYEELLNQE